MKSALSEAGKMTASAASSGLPSRFKGIASMMDFHCSSDYWALISVSIARQDTLQKYT